MNKKFTSIILLFIFASMLFAQGVPKLELTIIDKKMNMTQAEKEGRIAVSVKPGDVIRYTIIASNTGNGILTSPLITNPVPQGVSYNPLSAKGMDSVITFSIDGGNIFRSWPVTYKVEDENGRLVEKLASPDMVTHVRWELTKPMAPNESRQLEFEVIVK
jgi:uncharacterized repeat protein (TIGR01451 family)